MQAPSCRGLREVTKRNKKDMKSKEIIRLDNIKRDFTVGNSTVHALRGISFSIEAGEFVTIMGTSGSGKSTLLNLLGCLDTPTSGEYYLDGVAVRSMGRSERALLRNRIVFGNTYIPIGDTYRTRVNEFIERHSPFCIEPDKMSPADNREEAK